MNLLYIDTHAQEADLYEDMYFCLKWAVLFLNNVVLCIRFE